jgi:hypothetical protein
MVATDTHTTIEELFEAGFSVRSVPRLYNESQLPLEMNLETAVRRVEVGVRWPPVWELVSWSNELVVGQSPASKNLSTETADIVGISNKVTTSEGSKLRTLSTWCSALQSE